MKLLNASMGKYPNLSLVLLGFILEQLSGIDNDLVAECVTHVEKIFPKFSAFYSLTYIII